MFKYVSFLKHSVSITNRNRNRIHTSFYRDTHFTSQVTMEPKRILCLFDVDGTLTLPRKAIDEETFSFLMNLKEKCAIGLVGGSDFSKITEQMGSNFIVSDVNYLFAENGLVAYKDGEEIERQSIAKYMGEIKLQTFINYCLKYMSGLTLPVKRGTFIEFRTGLINVSPVGRSCSQEERDDFEKYDAIRGIRKQFVESLKQDLPDIGLQYSIGGQISFDAFPVGWDKRYCLRFLDQFKGNIHFFGDKTYDGGNDYEIYTHADVIGHKVTCPADTLQQLKNLFHF